MRIPCNNETRLIFMSFSGTIWESVKRLLNSFTKLLGYRDIDQLKPLSATMVLIDSELSLI